MKPVTKNEIITALENLGLSKGDNVMVHTSLSRRLGQTRRLHRTKSRFVRHIWWDLTTCKTLWIERQGSFNWRWLRQKYFNSSGRCMRRISGQTQLCRTQRHSRKWKARLESLRNSLCRRRRFYWNWQSLWSRKPGCKMQFRKRGSKADEPAGTGRFFSKMDWSQQKMKEICWLKQIQHWIQIYGFSHFKLIFRLCHIIQKKF